MAGIHSEWQAGAQVGRDGFCRTTPIAAAFARKCYGDYNHFVVGPLTGSTSAAGWTITQITATSSGTVHMADEVGGWLNLKGGTHDGAGVQMQSQGEAFLCAANKDIYYELSLKATDADDLDWFVGLSNTDTNVFSTDPDNIIAFRGDDSDANIDFQVRSAGTGNKADTGTDLVNATAIRLGFYVKGVTSVTPYINGAALTAVTANIPTSEMCLVFGMLNGAMQANNILAIDWYRALQLL